MSEPEHEIDTAEPAAGQPGAAPDDPQTTEKAEAATDSAQDSPQDFEGPRRRARREREERRAAQARAMAIEQARREAKRKVDGRAEPQRPAPARRVIRGLKLLMWTALLSVVVVGLGLVLYFTPVMSVRATVITGLSVLTEDEVSAAAAVPTGTPLLQVDTDAVAERVATLRRVASARVQREYPSTLRITVVERVPLVVKDFPDGPHLYDKDGVDFFTGPPPPGLAYLDTDTPGPKDPATKAALQVLTSLPPEVAGQVSRIAAPSVASITLTLIDGRTVVWGTNDRTQEKALKLAALLTQPGRTYDVSSPDLPTVK
ncbi:cell division protein ftsQ [Mycolicibacterium canariasense]|uniref:Cell division protein FtsQ n=1 Tax=Mycolicibacterium canariasense TaxID=228230 RepID=A0A100W896_MYCCR|nr:FtsQ-type POTRA domain-containing protein [Mycolicibacterium canariasense]MCV7212259.1 FtsQ-type POTRA domain-containing protein [Mycolicibacterium canariasense]ORU97394.1 cell division protein FtsQ [Mycolicibacterium canariasense]GAS93343.1 cell division protein ftsQ [Mycolicibacterium canariasense]